MENIARKCYNDIILFLFNNGEYLMEQKILYFECVGIKDGGVFPLDNTGRGRDVSPEFVIHNLAPGAQTLIITLEDLSHPIKNFTHWVIWNIPAMAKIPAAIPAGKNVAELGNAIQGAAYGWRRYAGPKPPKGKTHKYRFTIYALDCRLDLGAFATKRKVLKMAAGHIVQRGSICGYFE